MQQIKDFLSKVTVVDTETTGIDFDESEIIELATGRYNDLQNDDLNVFSVLIKPIHDIPPEASSVNYISNRMVANQPIFDEMLEVFDEMFKFNDTHFMVAHNAEFDRRMIETAYGRVFASDRFKPFDEERRWICTLRLAKVILSDENIKHNLGYLRYYLDLDVPDDMVAHRADTDVITCGKLLEKLIELAVEKDLLNLDEDLEEQLLSLCWNPIKIKFWPFGKHKGKALKEIPTDYYMWAIEKMDCLNEENSNYDNDLATSVGKILESRL